MKKKMVFVLTLVVLSALALAACSPATSTVAPTSEATMSSAVTDTPAAGADMTATPAATMEASATPMETETTAATETMAPEATATAASTAMSAGEFVKLSSLLNMNVNGKDGAALGKITGVVLNPTAMMSGSVASAVNVPQVAYLVVDTGSGSTVLVPWQAVAMDSSAMSADASALNLTIDQTALSGAPKFDAAAFKGTLPSDLTAYWTGLNMTLPNMDSAASMANAVLLQAPFQDITLNDANGKPYAKVSDMVLDAKTGDVLYGLLTGGVTWNGKTYVVPMSLLDSAKGMMNGMLESYALTLPSMDMINQAPSLETLNSLNLNSTDWNGLINQYWNFINPTPTP